MAIRFHSSASWHGISHDRSRYVIEHCVCPLYSDGPDEEDLVVFLGPDQRDIPLEVIAIELADGDLLVIHAMRLRRKYLDDYVRVMECQPE